MAAAGNPTFGAGGTANKLTGLTLKEVSRYFKESVVAGKTVWKCTVNDCKGEVGSTNGMHKHVQHHHRNLMRLGFELKVGEGNTREGNADIEAMLTRQGDAIEAQRQRITLLFALKGFAFSWLDDADFKSTFKFSIPDGFDRNAVKEHTLRMAGSPIR